MAQPLDQEAMQTAHDTAMNSNGQPQDDLLARKLNQVKIHDKDNSSRSALLTNNDNEEVDDEVDAEIQHAPLLSETSFSKDNRDAVPQFGLLGSHERAMLFLNTNAPFSAFICGVQGSGKSHTTACILENALTPSKQLGRLEKPLSALVFSYGQFGGDGSGFSISEAAFLGAPNPSYPDNAHVKKVHVLVSPSNYVKMSKLYLRVPNVSALKFKLKPQNLDIEIMLTLMNVITQIFRQMATEGFGFNYLTFKARLKKCRVNPAQINMLQMRLGLLESFLDLDNSCPIPQFNEGEVTIMDMSCPFVDANTACILFRIGLQRYLQSKAAGKMVVLYEAHRICIPSPYILPNPGAKALNESLLATIQPMLLTNLIALCSVTVIHRFSSPEWFAAIKRHVAMKPEEHHMVMRAIESLKTGTAFAAIIWKDEEGRLVKGVGKFLDLKVRKRVTNDGGQSVLAV
ncbi:hypothetical protein CC86DRAFT_416381 [Ophiobolus disseminans]|uniref:Uncharacterized protein n=1 Tax=Ophiobolus disseminans TaxID=1469910 RepID=A0A6A7A055_9PLEO|nr:hypothetical protein CC86DRAFT_416381 [Ophiobolus disseminans]